MTLWIGTLSTMPVNAKLLELRSVHAIDTQPTDTIAKLRSMVNSLPEVQSAGMFVYTIHGPGREYRTRLPDDRSLADLSDVVIHLSKYPPPAHLLQQTAA